MMKMMTIPADPKRKSPIVDEPTGTVRDPGMKSLTMNENCPSFTPNENTRCVLCNDLVEWLDQPEGAETCNSCIDYMNLRFSS